jgi:integrase
LGGEDGVSTTAFPLSDAARIVKGALKDRSYRATPLGLEVARYIRWKRNEWGATEETLRDYEAILARLAIFHADLELSDFEPSAGIELCRDFWDHHWGHRSERTRAKTLSVMRDFFKWACAEGKMVGNPALAMQRPKKRKTERHTFTRDQVLSIIEGQSKLHNKIACRLIVQYGLRRAELAGVQRKHFDFERQRLFVRGKGGTVRYAQLADPVIWRELGQLELERQWQPDEYLLFAQKRGPRWRKGGVGYDMEVLDENRLKPLVNRTVHSWWYRCLTEAGIVDKGVTSGQNMHRGRHTAGQALLDHTKGNLKAVQKFLGHADFSTTADTYVDWDDSQLAEDVRSMFAQDEV